jgi:hypothetical protein
VNSTIGFDSTAQVHVPLNLDVPEALAQPLEQVHPGEENTPVIFDCLAQAVQHIVFWRVNDLGEKGNIV